MKKITSILLVLLLLGTLSVPAFAQGTSDEPQLIVSTVEAKPGDEVAVTISIQNNPGIGVINPKFVFDSSRLQWLGYEEGGLKGWTVTEKAGVWLGNSDSDYNGVILTLRFKVLDTAQDGLAEVRLICGDGDAYNYAEELILFQLVSGGVQVGGQTHQHSSGPETRENEIAAGCTRPGSYDTVVKCSECGAEISRVTVPIPAAGHRYDLPRFQWSEDLSEATAYFICAEKDDVQETAATVSHRTVSEGEEYVASVSFQGRQYSETRLVAADGSEKTTLQDTEAPAAAEEVSSPAEADKTPEAPAEASPEATAEPSPEAAAEAAAPAESPAAGRGFPVLPMVLICCALAAIVILLILRSRAGKSKQN